MKLTLEKQFLWKKHLQNWRPKMKPIKKYKIYWSPQFTNEFKKILTFMNCQFSIFLIKFMFEIF